MKLIFKFDENKTDVAIFRAKFKAKKIRPCVVPTAHLWALLRTKWETPRANQNPQRLQYSLKLWSKMALIRIIANVPKWKTKRNN